MSALKSRKEREKKPWLSEIYRRFGTPIGPLKEPLHLSMDGRVVGTSLNNIRVIRPPDFRVLTVDDIRKQKEQSKNHMNPLQNEVFRSANQTQKSKRPEPKRLRDKKIIKKNANSIRPKRPEPKRLRDKKLIKKNANSLKTKRRSKVTNSLNGLK